MPMALLALMFLAGCSNPRPIPLRVYSLRFQVAKEALATLEIRDAGGNLCRTLAAGKAAPVGPWEAEWDGRDGKGKTVPAGEYQAVLLLKRFSLEPNGCFGGVGSTQGKFLSPKGLSLHPQGALLTVAVADTGNQRVQLLTENGAYLQAAGTFGAGEGRLSQPTAVNWDGQILTVCDSQNRRLARFDALGGFLGEVRVLTGLFTGPTADRPLDFRNPTHLAPLLGDSFWVSDPGYGVVQRLTANGGVLDRWGGSFSLNQDGPLAQTPDGVLWLVVGGKRLLRLGANGAVLGETKTPARGRLTGLFAGDGFLAASSPEDGRLWFFDPEGAVFGEAVPSGAARPGALAIWEDRLFLIDEALSRVCQYRLVSSVQEMKRTLETTVSANP